MHGFLSGVIDKLYFKHWVIGLCHDSIKDIIRTRNFRQDIKWLSLNKVDHYNADPFLLKTEDGVVNVLYEDYTLSESYGKICVMALDNNLNPVSSKVVLDTKSHLSYPFVFREYGKIYVFPEASQSGSLSCYEYDTAKKSLRFQKVIINLPLLDSTILKHNNKYWLFGTVKGKDSHSKLYIFHSNNLMGPYSSHRENPVKDSAHDSRPAGNFFEVDDNIYRPTQDCSNFYGESLVINKVNVLNEYSFKEEPYMTISINEKNMNENRIHTIHTINVLDDIIAIDGKKWTFSPVNQLRFFQINRRMLKQARQKKININKSGMTDV